MVGVYNVGPNEMMCSTDTSIASEMFHKVK